MPLPNNALAHSVAKIHVHPSVNSVAKLNRLLNDTGLVAFQSNRGRRVILLTPAQAAVKRAVAQLSKGAVCR